MGYWICGQSREYKLFISHRVGEIRECSVPSQWCYVPINVNPVDHGTRGLTVEELANTSQWWSGKFEVTASEESLELKRGKEVSGKKTCSYETTKGGEENVDGNNAREEGVWRLNPSRYSKWYWVKPKGELELGLSLVTVKAWVHRFTANCRRPANQRLQGDLTPLELEDAEEAIIREVQTEKYAAEMDVLRRNKQIPRQSTLAPLNPVLVNGILRSNTRLQQADNLPYEVKRPIILPKRDQVTGLIVKYYHESEGHQMGLNYTINHLRARYFVVHAREQVKRVMRECLECAKPFRSRPACQQMAPLPRIRLQQSSRPFVNCAVDFGGPYLTKQGRSRVRAKRNLCLFLCLQTHCCHLDLESPLDIDAFLNAFIRMTPRRGWPKQMLSGNGTNFLSSSREINELVSAIDQDKVQQMTSNKCVTWNWNPPAAPHFGGVFESVIKSAKCVIAAVIGAAEVNDKELETIFIGLESLLNSRPLTTVSDDFHDEPVLTPNHFLIGHMGVDFVPESVDTTPFNSRKCWQRT